jgi:hypothetical protein
MMLRTIVTIPETETATVLVVLVVLACTTTGSTSTGYWSCRARVVLASGTTG